MLKDALTLAGDHLVRVLSPDHHFMPFYEIHINERMEAWAWLRAPAHNTARWIDAMLRLEACTDYRIPDDIDAAMAGSLRLVFDNPDSLCLFPMDRDAFPRNSALSLLEFHSMREGLLALTALIQHRDDPRARETATRMIDTVDRITDTGLEPWNVQFLDRWKRLDEPGAPVSRTTLDSGRFIEAAMHYVNATGNEQALALAGRLAAIHYEHNTWPGGTYEINWATYHTHSYLGTLKGLLLYGEASGEKKYVNRVAETYANSIRHEVIKESGLAFHDGDKETGADLASAGDAVQLALWLARVGYPEFLDDAARLVHARLLPAQLTDCPPLTAEELPMDADGNPCFINQVSLEPRSVSGDVVVHPKNMHIIANGAWSIQREAHWGKQATTDVTCSVLHSLCDYYSRILTPSGDRLRIEFHEDYEDDLIRMSSSYGEHAELRIENRGNRALEVRMPAWVPIDSVRVVADDTPLESTLAGGVLTCPPGTRITLTYELPERTTQESAHGVAYTFRWRGDRVLGISPNNEQWLPLYPTLQTGQ